MQFNLKAEPHIIVDKQRFKLAFSLVEMSVVIAVMAFILVMTLTAAQSGAKIYKIKENKQRIESIQNALRAYFARNNRLPYPADPSLTVSNANFGIENTTTLSTTNGFINQGNGTGSFPRAHIVWGAVPVATLGLDLANAYDSYGNVIDYIVPTHIANPIQTTVSEFNGWQKYMYERTTVTPCPRPALCPSTSLFASQTSNTGGGTPYTYLSSYNLRVINNRNATAVPASINNMSYAIISHGANGSCAWNKNGTRNSEDGSNNLLITSNEKYNCFRYWVGGNLGFSTGPWYNTTRYGYITNTGSSTPDSPITLYGGNSASDFDDVVAWESLESIFLAGSDVTKYASISQQNNQSEWVAASGSPGGIYYVDGATKNVGINVTSPAQKLDINGNFQLSGGSILLKQPSPGTLSSEIIANSSDLSLFYNSAAATPEIKLTNGATTFNGTITSNGNIATTGNLYLTTDGSSRLGIGTSTPSYPIHVAYGITPNLKNISPNNQNYSYYRNGNNNDVRGQQCDSSSNNNDRGCSNDIGIYSPNASVAAQSFGTVSDRRTKKNFSPTDNLKDLETISKLKITNYNRIDGNKQEKKLIAQEVEELYPNAIIGATGFIPNVYQNAKIKSIKSDKSKTTTLMLDIGNVKDISKGDTIKLLYNDTEYQGIAVKLSPLTISIKDFKQTKNKNIFVYGKFVNDFKTIDYDAISMLNVSAVQALNTKLNNLEKTILQHDNILNKAKNINETDILNDIKRLKSQNVLKTLFLTMLAVYSFILTICVVLIYKKTIKMSAVKES